jgi:branched-chain amino acid transport system permease protein
MMNRFSNAFIAAVLAGIIVAPVFGLQIVRAGMNTHLESD